MDHKRQSEAPAGQLAAEPSLPSRHERDLSALWSPDYVGRIASFLSPNEAACLRLVNKATAQELADRTTINLSQLVPRWAYQQRWGPAGSCRALTARQRCDLVKLTACSNDVANLEVALAATGVQRCRRYTAAAAAAGALDSCRFLALREEEDANTSRDLLWDVAMAAAAEGHGAVVGWALEHLAADKRGKAAWRAACGAARGGHVSLMDRMLAEARAIYSRGGEELSEGDKASSARRLILDALAGCDLATVQRLCAETIGGAQALREWRENELEGAIFAALYSLTPDWEAKTELVLAAKEGVDYSECYMVYDNTPFGEGLEARFEWLKAHGAQPASSTLYPAVQRGNTAAFCWLRAEGVIVSAGEQTWLSELAAHQGNERMLQAMKQDAHWLLIPAELARDAARGGQVHVLDWIWEAFGWSDGSHGLTRYTHAYICCYGSVEAIRWAREHGAGGWNELEAGCWGRVARSGCEAAVELLAELGCPKPADGSPYEEGPWYMFPLLRRLGLSFGRASDKLFACCVEHGAPLPTLRWLLEQGCPVAKWAEVEEAVGRRRSSAGADAVLAWVLEQWDQREGRWAGAPRRSQRLRGRPEGGHG